MGRVNTYILQFVYALKCWIILTLQSSDSYYVWQYSGVWNVYLILCSRAFNINKDSQKEPYPWHRSLRYDAPIAYHSHPSKLYRHRHDPVDRHDKTVSLDVFSHTKFNMSNMMGYNVRNRDCLVIRNPLNFPAVMSYRNKD